MTRLDLDARGSARRRFVGLLPAAVCSWSASSWAKAPAPEASRAKDLRIGGNGTGTTVLRRLLEDWDWPGVRFAPNLGSSGGLKAMEAGAIDLAVSARRLKDDEIARGLIERELFRSPSAPAVHAGVQLRDVTVDQLAGFYAGDPAFWPDGLPVRLVLRPDRAAETQSLRALGPRMSAAVAKAKSRPGFFVATNANDALSAIERIPGSLGITSLAMNLAEQRNIHLLSLEGVPPTLEALRSGRYHFMRSIYLVTTGSADDRIAALMAALYD